LSADASTVIFIEASFFHGMKKILVPTDFSCNSKTVFLMRLHFFITMKE